VRPAIHVCIPVHNRKAYTRACLESVRRQTYRRWRVVVCDDGSTDGSAALIRRSFPEVDLVKGDGSLWWAGAMNAAVGRVLETAGNGDYVYSLNNDTELFPDTLANLAVSARRFPAAIIGTVNLFFDDPGRIEPSAFIETRRWPLAGTVRRLNGWGEPLNGRTAVVEADSLNGKGALIPVSAFRTVGLYRSDLLPQYHADTEFTVRARRAGFGVRLDYGSRLKSHRHASGIGSATSEPAFREFAASFASIRSPHHYASLKNRCRLVYGERYAFHLAFHLAVICLGFSKRWLRSRLGLPDVPK
jgi:GT2 family glycosyltransferase